MLVDSNKDLTDQLRFSKLKKKNISQGSRSPQACLTGSASIKFLNSTPKATSPQNFFKAEVSNAGSNSKKKMESHHHRCASALDKRAKSKVRRNNSSMLKVDRDRLNTESNLKRRISNENSPKPMRQQSDIHSYLAKKGKSPSAGGGPNTQGMSKAGANKNFSFTTINNISMQNLINKNIPNYQMFLSKTYLSAAAGGLSAKEAGMAHRQSPTGHSSSGLFLNNSKASGLGVFGGVNQHQSSGGSKDNQTPNFQKKLKKYISKRANVLKKAAGSG